MVLEMASFLIPIVPNAFCANTVRCIGITPQEKENCVDCFDVAGEGDGGRFFWICLLGKSNS